MTISSTFYSTMWTHAKTASSLTGIPTEVILAQWALESNNGQSDLAKRANNFAGIKSSSKGKDFTSGAYAGYLTKSRFAKDYARVMNLSYYDGVRSAGKTAGLEDDIAALGKSPYAEDSSYATKIAAKVKELTGMDITPVTDLAGEIKWFYWAGGAFIAWFIWWR